MEHTPKTKLNAEKKSNRKKIQNRISINKSLINNNNNNI